MECKLKNGVQVEAAVKGDGGELIDTLWNVN